MDAIVLSFKPGTTTGTVLITVVERSSSNRNNIKKNIYIYTTQLAYYGKYQRRRHLENRMAIPKGSSGH